MVATSETPHWGQTRHESANPKELRDRMQELAVEHTVQPLGGRLSGMTTGVRLGDVKLAFVKYGAPTRVVAEATRELLCWTIPVGPMQVEVAKRRGALREGFLLDQDGPTVMTPSPEKGAVVLTTNVTALRNHLSKLLGKDAPTLDPAPGPSSSPARGQVNLAWRYIAESLALTPDPPDALRKSLGETLLTALLFELPASAALLAADEATQQRPAKQHVDRAIEWATANFTRPVQVNEWARAVSISVRHLQVIMQNEFGCTPREYLQALRLERAHSLLRESPPDRTITSIATSSGFTHLGRFAALYRKHYGISPTNARER